MQQIRKECLDLVNCIKLTINSDKTHFVDIIGQTLGQTSIHESIITLTLGQTSIHEFLNTKYLGMIIQNDLKWDLHINAIIKKKLNSCIPLYYTIRDIIPYNKRIMIYNSMSASLINYGIELYAKNKNKWTYLLQKAQNRSLKILLKLRKLTSTNRIHKSNELLKIDDLAKLRLALISHKVIHHPHETNIATHSMKPISMHHSLRNDKNLSVEAHFLNKNNKIIEQATIVWNSLPRNIKQLNNTTIFKREYKDLALRSYI